MILNYLKIALRVLTRNKLVSVINIFGLALALAGSLLIAVFIHDELLYDQFNENANRIYRVTRNYVTPEGSEIMHLGHLAPPFSPLLKNDFSEIIESTRLYGPFGTPMALEGSTEPLDGEVENGYFAEPSVFKIFSLDIVKGDARSPLDRPFTMLLSDKIARHYFGNADVVGKLVHVADTTVEITGIYKALPNQSHWHPDFLISFTTLNDDNLFGSAQLQNNWENNSFLTYILVDDKFDAEKAAQAFPAFIDKHMPMGNDPIKKSASTNLILQPLTSIHLHSHLDSEAETNGSINNVYAMESIGVFLIVIACFNFVNLSTARATQRGKEVGLRKVSGALRQQLIFQYMGESTLTTLLAMVVAIAVATACLPWLNNFTAKSISLQEHMNMIDLSIVAAIVVIVGVIAGIYPAFVISGYQPAQILKGQSGSINRGIGVRKALVVVQFSISIVIIIATMVTYQQLEFLNNKDLGYSKEQIVVFGMPDELRDHYDAFYASLLQHPAIVNATRTNRMPTLRLLETNNVSAVQSDTAIQKTEMNMKNVSIDRNFFDTYHIPFVSGKNFSKEMKTGATFEEQVANGFILNETAAKLLGWNAHEAVGKVITNGGIKEAVIGVVKDFHFESLREPITPIVFISYDGYRQVSVLISAGQMKEGIDGIEQTWKQFVTREPFSYEFLNERYNRLYSSEASQNELFFIFAALAIFIASLGLFGLATFNVVKRNKEVSIRKVLGASVRSILQLLSTEVVVLIAIANVVAWPIAWYLMKQWLGGFAYHIEMSIVTYMATGLLTMLLTIVIISTQTLKAALTNPATMLRSE